jgi:serine/threonine protein phosphatase PrpC
MVHGKKPRPCKIWEGFFHSSISIKDRSGMLKSLDYAFIAYLGSQGRQNGDSYIHNNNLFVVIDGVGGDYLGGIAEQQANKIITEAFFNHLSGNDSPSEAIIFSLKEANKAILEERMKIGEKMAASVSIIYFQGKIMYFSHLGDSRIYSFQDGELSQLTRDHTLREEDPFAEKRFNDPRALQALTQGLGIHEKLNIKVKKYPVDKRGFILMTTEGLTERVSNLEIQWLFEKVKNPKKICKSLIDLTKRKGGDGNLTVGVVRYGLLAKWFRNVLITYSAFFLIILIFAWGYFLKYDKDEIPEEVDVTPEITDVKNVSKDIIKSEQREEVSPPPVKVKTIREPIIVEDIVEDSIETEESQAVSSADLYDRIYKFVSEWKSAWENTAGKNRKMEKYISFYSKDFESGNFDRNSWELDKSRKNRRKQWIKIEISDIKISGPNESNHIEVRFRQDYRSSNYSGISEKSITLKQEGDGWKIISERSY